MGCDHIKKVNGMGDFASVPEEDRKAIVDMYCQGMSLRTIAAKTGYSHELVNDIRVRTIDADSQFRDKMFQLNLRQKLQTVVEGAADRVNELMPDMSAKDAVLALGIAADKLANLEKAKGPDSLHQHVHLHAPAELSQQFMAALNPNSKT